MIFDAFVNMAKALAGGEENYQALMKAMDEADKKREEERKSRPIIKFYFFKIEKVIKNVVKIPYPYNNKL